MPWDVLLVVGLVLFACVTAAKRASRPLNRLRDSDRIGLLAGPTRSDRDRDRRAVVIARLGALTAKIRERGTR